MSSRLTAAEPTNYSLQRRLLLVLLGSLTLVCILLGLLYNAGMRQTLMTQLQGQLNEAADRAAVYSRDQSSPNERLFAPGQASGTLNARFVDRFVFSGAVLDARTGKRVEITQLDVTPLITLDVGAEPVQRQLSIGRYLLVAREDPGSDGVLITGLPLEPTENALRQMSWLTLIISLLSVVGAGLLGTWAIGRSLAPLRRVAAVASSVAETDLDSGKVQLPQRVGENDAIPGTEVGNVGLALNALLDNVATALMVRERSQGQMRQFVADASHELRTPLTAIRGYTDLLAATEHFSEDGRRSVDRVKQQSSRMGELIENLLLLARLEETRTVDAKPVELCALASDITEDFRATATSHHWKVDCPTPVMVNADAPSLRRVITNLLANARKHTSEGNTVTVIVRADENEQEAVLQVHDTGEGIAPDFLPHVFERFSRADAARSGADGTTGLGLPIARTIVEAHEGEITVTSTPGDTVFEIRLPLLDDQGEAANEG